MSEPAKSIVRATYTSPSGTRVFTKPISTPLPSSDSPTSVKDKVAYLSEVRASTKQLQEDINVFLTRKMAEESASVTVAPDGAVDGSDKSKKQVSAFEDELEEENYGEEVMG